MALVSISGYQITKDPQAPNLIVPTVPEHLSMPEITTGGTTTPGTGTGTGTGTSDPEPGSGNTPGGNIIHEPVDP